MQIWCRQCQQPGLQTYPKRNLPDSDNFKVFSDSKPTKNIHQVRQINGTLQFPQIYVKSYAQTETTMQKLTSKETKWREGELPKDCLKAYYELEAAFVQNLL